MMNADLIPAKEQYEMTTSYVSNVKEAAERLEVSETTIRQTAKRLGVKKISGPTVAGFVLFASSPVDVSMPYFE